MKVDCVVASLVLMLGLAASNAAAQDDRRPAQQIADSTEMARVAREVTANARSDSARASMLYAWVANTIRYDADSFLKGRVTNDRAENVYRTRLGVCAGYVAVYTRMAREVGLETERISGYAKGYGYALGQGTTKSNHAWVAVRLENGWQLIDPTWGSGVLRDGKFEPAFNWDYFLTDPEALVLSHFPEEKSWQLVKQPLNRKEFERMPAVPYKLLSFGFDAATLRQTALTPGVREFPLLGNPVTQVRVLKAPAMGVLARATDVTIDVIWTDFADVALVTAGVWTPLARVGDRWQGNVRAAANDVALVGRRNADTPYETLLYYQVR